MGRPTIDLTGRRFGRLVVLREAPERHRTAGGTPIRQWVCQCDCGRTVTLLQPNLTKPKPAQSCGCAWGAGPRTKPKDRVSTEAAQAEIAENAADKKPGWKLVGPGGEIAYTENLSQFCRDRGFRKPLQAAQRLSSSWIYFNGGDTGRARNVTVEGWRVVGRNPLPKKARKPSDYTGINWHKGRRKWQLTYRGKYVGLYDTQPEAALALYKLKSDEKP